MNNKNIKTEYVKFNKVFCEIDRLLSIKETVNVAIDGNSGAGKSTLASIIQGNYDCNIFHMDDYFLRPELRTQDRLNEIGGNVDYVRFKDEIIDGLKSGEKFIYRAYDCKQMVLGEAEIAIPKKLNIIEGSYSMHPTLIEAYDLKIFLQIDENEQRNRILQRNGTQMLQRFLEEWIPKENLYFTNFKIKELSDLVFS